jgi:HK97 family phage major capsid protein
LTISLALDEAAQARVPGRATRCGRCKLELTGGYPQWRAHWKAEHGTEHRTPTPKETSPRMSSVAPFDTATRADIDRLRQEIRERPGMSAADYDRFTRARTPEARAELIDEIDFRYQSAFFTWLRRGVGGLDAEQRAALETAGRPNSYLADATGPGARQLRALAEGTGNVGGYTVPPGFLQRLQAGMKRTSPMARVAELQETQGGAAMTFPTTDDTANTGSLIAEAAALPTPTDPTFGQKAVNAWMYTSGAIKASVQLVQDQAVDVPTWLGRTLGARVGRIANLHFTTGDGSSKPTGLQPGLTVGKQVAVGGTVTCKYDDLVDVLYSVDAEYRELPPEEAWVGWMGSDAAIRMARKALEASGREVTTEDHRQLLGFPVMSNPDWPVPAASVRSLAFGAFSLGYLVRSVIGDVIVLELNQLYAANLQRGYLAASRWDGLPTDPLAIKCLQQSAT